MPTKLTTSPRPEHPSTRRRSSRFLAVAIGALALLGFAAAPAQAGAPKTFYGVVPQTAPTAADYVRLSQGNIGTLRIGIFWSAVDGAAPAGGYDFSSIDPIVARAAMNGIEAVPYLYGTPRWVAEGLDGYNCGEACGTYAPRSHAALAAWADFVHAAVARYGNNGTLWSQYPSVPKRPIRAWQLWNEQNSSDFFAPQANPKAYAPMLAAGAPAVKSADPAGQVVLGGMPQLNGVAGVVPGTKYLRKLYKVKGIKSKFDGVGVHPYTVKAKGVVGQVQAFRKEMTRARDRKATMWITETGWSSHKGENPLSVGERAQATRLKQTYKAFGKLRKKLRIKTVAWYSYTDSSVAVCEWCGTAGLLTESGVPKPAWNALMKFTGGS